MKEPRQPHPKIRSKDPTRPKLCSEGSGPMVPGSKTDSKGPEQPAPQANIRSPGRAKLRRDSDSSRDATSEIKTAKLYRAMPRAKGSGSDRPML